MALRVFHLISSGGYYGAEAVVLSLVRALNRAGCKAVLGVFNNEHQPHTEVAERAIQHGHSVEIIPCKGRMDCKAVRLIRQLVDENRFHILHTHGYKADLYGYLAARRLKIRLVATEHLWTGATTSVKLYEWLDRRIVKRFDHVSAVSQPIYRILERNGLAPEKISIIANGVETEGFVNARPTLWTGAAPPPGPCIGLVGRLAAQKGADYFIAAAKEVVAGFPQTTFVLVGDGPWRNKLIEQAQQLGIARQVIFAGARNDMPGVYASLDIMVLPSRNEGMPVALLEAFAAGKPVIASSVGEIPMAVVDGYTGLLVAPGDVPALAAAMKRLLSRPDLRSELGRNAAACVREQFSSDRMAAEYLDIYFRLSGPLRQACTSRSCEAVPSSPMTSGGGR